MSTIATTPGNRRDFIILVLIFLGCFLLQFLSGCTSTSKAVRILKKRGALAGVCAQEYKPVVDTIYSSDSTVVYDTTYQQVRVPGKDSISTDSFYVYRTITKTIHTKDTVTIRKEITERVQALQDTLAAQRKVVEKQLAFIQVQSKKIDAKNTQIIWQYVAISLLLLLLVLVIFHKAIWNAIKARIVSPIYPH